MRLDLTLQPVATLNTALIDRALKHIVMARIVAPRGIGPDYDGKGVSDSERAMYLVFLHHFIYRLPPLPPTFGFLGQKVRDVAGTPTEKLRF